MRDPEKALKVTKERREFLEELQGAEEQFQALRPLLADDQASRLRETLAWLREHPP